MVPYHERTTGSGSKTTGPRIASQTAARQHQHTKKHHDTIRSIMKIFRKGIITYAAYQYASQIKTTSQPKHKVLDAPNKKREEKQHLIHDYRVRLMKKILQVRRQVYNIITTELYNYYDTQQQQPYKAKTTTTNTNDLTGGTNTNQTMTHNNKSKMMVLPTPPNQHIHQHNKATRQLTELTGNLK